MADSLTISCTELDKPTHNAALVKTNKTLKAKGAVLGSKGSAGMRGASFRAKGIKLIPIGAVKRDNKRLVLSLKINCPYRCAKMINCRPKDC
jgi:hypothetical protein